MATKGTTEIKVISNIKSINNLRIEVCDDTSVGSFLCFLAVKEDKEAYNENRLVIPADYDLLGRFVFIDAEGISRKGRLDYSLLGFLENFRFDTDDLQLDYDPNYGIGAAGEIEGVAFVTVHPGEPHFEPHAHISRKKYGAESYRISLNTFTQFKGDKHPWSNEFKRRERKEIISCLKKNSAHLKDLYKRMKKGEYITEYGCLEWNGKKIEMR